MKTTVLKTGIIAFFMATAIHVSAQEGFQLGIEGTPQMSWLMNKDDQDNSSFKYENTYNVSFGITAQYGFDKNMGVALNVLYSYQGQKYKYHDIERVKKQEYLKIPLMFAYNYDINDKLMFMGKIGPQLGLLMKARLTDKDNNDIVKDQNVAYQDVDFGAVVYAGIGCKVTDNLCILANLRFDYGFLDVENKDYKYSFNDPSAFSITNGGSNSNRAVTNNVTVGLTIGIKYAFASKMERE